MGDRDQAGDRQASLRSAIVATVLAPGFDILPVAGLAEHAVSLPLHHGDPFDRLLIAQAQLEGMVLGTQDRLMRAYGVVTIGLD